MADPKPMPADRPDDPKCDHRMWGRFRESPWHALRCIGCGEPVPVPEEEPHDGQ